MSDTAQLFFVAGVWAVIALFIARLVPGWPARVVVYALLVGTPFWELPFGYLNFRSVCLAESRVLVFRDIPPQRNVCVDYPFEDAATEVLKAGFESVEARGSAGEVRRYVSSSASDRREGRQDKLTADYCFASASNVSLPWRILRHDHLVRLSNGGDIVARQSRFNWSGMWWQEAMRPVLGRGGECAQEMSEIFRAVRFGQIRSSN